MFLLIQADSSTNSNCQQFESVDRIHVAIRSIDRTLYNRVFSCIQKLFFPKTKRFIQNHGGNEEDAWDVFQDVSSALFVRIKNERKDLPVGDTGLPGYLMTMIKYTWYQRFRKKSNRELTWDPFEMTATDETDFLQLYQDMDFANALDKALKDLSDAEKEFIRLKYFEEKSYQEIEELTGRNAKSLKSNQGRIFTKLKTLLAKYI